MRSKQVEKVTHLNTNIDDIIEERFRDAVYKRYGLKKGAIKMALEEAIILWLKNG